MTPRMNRELDGQFGDYQNEIYTDGLSGVLPALPMEFQELEARARAALSPSLLSYVAGGAGDESTQRANVSAFLRWGLVPRMMAGAARRDMSVNLFGTRLPSPLFMAPVGVIGLCAQDGRGDLATARAAARTGVPMMASTLSVDPLEEVAAESGETPGFFSLYTPTDRELAQSLVRRAETAGFKGIVLNPPPRKRGGFLAHAACRPGGVSGLPRSALAGLRPARTSITRAEFLSLGDETPHAVQV